MDDAGLPAQTEDECVEVGGSTLAALLLEPLHQPRAHYGLLFGVVQHARAIARRSSLGSASGEDEEEPTKTTVVLSHARGVDTALASTVAPEAVQVVGLWVARYAAPPVPTLRDVAAVERLRESASDAILLIVACDGASAKFRCFVGGSCVRPCRVRVRTLTHDSRQEYENCPDGVLFGSGWPALRSAAAAPFDETGATAAFKRDRGLLDDLLADGARLGGEADTLEREAQSLRSAIAAARADREADATAAHDAVRDAVDAAARAALEADDALSAARAVAADDEAAADASALSAARVVAADDDAAAADDAELVEATRAAETVPPTPHNSRTDLVDDADATDGERTASPADLVAMDDGATIAQLQRDMALDDSDDDGNAGREADTDAAPPPAAPVTLPPEPPIDV